MRRTRKTRTKSKKRTETKTVTWRMEMRERRKKKRWMRREGGSVERVTRDGRMRMMRTKRTMMSQSLRVSADYGNDVWWDCRNTRLPFLPLP